MEYEQLAGLFKPPPPYSVEGHFDVVTKDKATIRLLTGLRQAYHFDIDGVLMLIKTRPSVEERAALLIILAHRLEQYGKARGFLDEPKPQTSAKKIFAEYILQDLIGIKPDGPDKKIYDQLQKLLAKYSDEFLNRRGKAALKLMEWLYDLASASNGNDRWRALLKITNSEIADYLKKNSAVLMPRVMKQAGFSKAVRSRIMKIIALRVAWVNAWGARCAKLSPIVFGLDLLLSPADLASGKDEERLGFLAMYTQVVADRRILLTNIIERAPGPDWKFSMDPGLAIRSAL